MATAEPAERVGTEPAVRVSTLELFFDLVFVSTMTALTAVLAKDLTWRGLGNIGLLLGVILWMYGGYAWLTNAVAPTNRLRRTLVLVGMGGFLVMALAIPDAFGASGWAFGAGYFVVNAVHSGLFLHSAGPGGVAVMRGLAPLNLLSAGLVLAGGFLPGPWRYASWAAALAVQIITPYLHSLGGYSISAAHFVERHGLVVIVALGESIVAIGIGAAGLTLDLRLVAVAVLGLTLSYYLWWVYFEGDDGGAERALAAVEPQRRPRAALNAYGYAHYPLLLGIVVLAAGVKVAIAKSTAELTLAQALALGGGVALFLFGDVAYRRVLSIGRSRYRLWGAIGVLATVPLGLVRAVAQLVPLIVVLLAMLVIEARAGRSRATWPGKG
ncbi:MAG: low temperature requirement protein A [Micromonosporaceae bacterium]